MLLFRIVNVFIGPHKKLKGPYLLSCKKARQIEKSKKCSYDALKRVQELPYFQS